MRWRSERGVGEAGIVALRWHFSETETEAETETVVELACSAMAIGPTRAQVYPVSHAAVRMVIFDHEKLDVYRLSMDFLVFADQVAQRLTGRRYYMADQLRRAAFSVCLNIAEGAGEFSRPEKQRFYRFARRSAVECAAIIRCCERLKIQLPDDTPANLEKLARIIAMLTVLTKASPRRPSPSPPPSPSPKNAAKRRVDL